MQHKSNDACSPGPVHEDAHMQAHALHASHPLPYGICKHPQHTGHGRRYTCRHPPFRQRAVPLPPIPSAPISPNTHPDPSLVQFYAAQGASRIFYPSPKPRLRLSSVYTISHPRIMRMHIKSRAALHTLHLRSPFSSHPSRTPFRPGPRSAPGARLDGPPPKATPCTCPQALRRYRPSPAPDLPHHSSPLSSPVLSAAPLGPALATTYLTTALPRTHGQ